MLCCTFIKIPTSFASTIGWMGLWWTGLRMLVLFFLHTWLSLLKSAINNFAPFLHYIYNRFISNQNNEDDSIDSLVLKLQKLIMFCFYFLCVDAIFQFLLIYGTSKKSFMWMLPWILYSFMTLIILTILPLDYYSQAKRGSKPQPDDTETSGLMYAVEQMSTYFLYLGVQLIFLIVVFDRFLKLRTNKSYYYLKKAVDIEKNMIVTMLDLYEQSIMARFTTHVTKKNTVQHVLIDTDNCEPPVLPKYVEVGLEETEF